MKLESAHENMIKMQVRACNICDDRIIECLHAIPRRGFVPVDYHHLAYGDMEIPIGHGQSMLRPFEETQLLQAVNLQDEDQVLEIGTGTGYMTALLATLSKHVTSVDIFPDFIEHAAAKLNQMDISNAHLFEGDAAQGWDHGGPYDVIVITGSLPKLPDSFRNCLTVGGRLFAIIGKAPAMHATLITREQENVWKTEVLFETVVTELLNATQPSTFSF